TTQHFEQQSRKIDGKNIVFDGHERDDVVKYQKEWTARIMEYKKLMKDYDDNEAVSAKVL
ncbi:hypothetical protein DFQ28_001006, partial [Apophysomyces sp. BC1034]